MMKSLGRLFQLTMVMAALTCAVGNVATAQTQVAPAVELALVVDTSGSVDDIEFELQRTGYVEAFRSLEVQNAIASAGQAGVRVTLIYFSDSATTAVPYTLLNSAADANDFADAIAAAPRTGFGETGVANAIRFATSSFQFDAQTQVIDVSGDGEENLGGDVPGARDAALAAGVEQINGLAIETTDFPNLNQYYIDNVIGGTDSFSIAVDNFDDFDTAVQNKIVVEVGGGDEVCVEGCIYKIIVFEFLHPTVTADLTFSQLDDSQAQASGTFQVNYRRATDASGTYVAGASDQMITAMGTSNSNIGTFSAECSTFRNSEIIIGDGVKNEGGRYFFIGKKTGSTPGGQ